MRDRARLTLRMHRFELVALGIATLALVIAAYVVAAQLDAIGYGPCAINPEGRPSGAVRCPRGGLLRA